MTRSISQVFVFLLVILGAYLWVGYTITQMTGGEKKSSAGGKVEVTPEFGEAVYWGRGRCFTCHSMGDRGSAVRGPNHGQFGAKFPLAMGSRAVERAKARSKKTGKKFTALDYLVESMAEPGAYVVEGYKNEMAVVYAPPISLGLDEIKAIVAYLQTQGGDLDLDAINKPSGITKQYYSRIQAAAAAGGGDPAHGKEVYEDNCIDCHKLKGEGGAVGPDLTLAGKKGLKFNTDSILKPAQEITKGFETHVLIAKDGRKTVGLKTRDEGNEIDITKADGDVVTITKDKIKELTIDKNISVMPEDMSEALTVKDFQDVLSFMMMQKGK